MRRKSGSIITVLIMLMTANAALSVPQTIICDGGVGPINDAIIPLASLKTAVNPVLPGGALRPDLAEFIRDKDAAIQLGKALFWEMQAGSDNKVACATCHFSAGGDRRDRNQISPGPNRTFDVQGANALFDSVNFPFTERAEGIDRDDIAGSQGIHRMLFKGLSPNGAEVLANITDPVFSHNGRNVRQVTEKKAPSVVNSVFNHRNFFNGRAQAEFNGVNPFGTRDVNARVWMVNSSGVPVKVSIAVPNASLASQAVGPPLNEVEMSAIGRTFPDIGRKLIRFKPLRLQQVSATDSVLSGLADTTTGKGLKVSYKTLIQQAFQPKWWNSTRQVPVTREPDPRTQWSQYTKKISQPYTMIEANFSLFWGLSIMLYEATLVSDDSPFDKYLDSGRTNLNVLNGVVSRLNAEGISINRDNIRRGLVLFETPQAAGGMGCIECHAGAALTTASVGNVSGFLNADDAEEAALGFDFRMERMFMTIPAVPVGTMGVIYDPEVYTMTAIANDGSLTPVPIAVYDAGFYNIGVRPTVDDLGLGGLDPFGNPLSFVRLFQQLALPVLVPGERLHCETTFEEKLRLSGPLTTTERTAEDGVFKVPALRNVEISGPYFHNGGKSTLRQALEMYDQGGDFPANPDLSPLIRPLNMSVRDMDDLLAFLIALTDERVRWRQAPFDHPQLLIPNGQNEDGSDIMVSLDAVGSEGASAPLNRFLDLNPFDL